MSVQNPHALLDRLCRETSENGWLEFKHNNQDPEMFGKCVSACANSAILASKERAFLVLGVADKTHEKLGATKFVSELKKGGENLVNWLMRMTSPQINISFYDILDNGKKFSILDIEPSYERPVKFMNVEYIRVGENIKLLGEFPEIERALWLATSRKKFEDAVAASHKSGEAVLSMLDIDSYYKLLSEPKPANHSEILRRLQLENLIKDDMEGGYNITNLGAILFAADMSEFPSLSGKANRVIRYTGKTKIKSDEDVTGKKGYATGFSELIKFVMAKLPKEEIYENGVRKMTTVYPESSIREVLANALIHQDFTITGAGPVVEIFSNRVEVTNPGNSLIEVDRIIDERRSRNEKLALAMRVFGICEERGGGIDKAIMGIEAANLPPPTFITSENSMRVVIFGPKPFNALTKEEKVRACFFHCVIKWLESDYMNNTSLRQRFKLDDADYQSVSAIITESSRRKRIIPADENQGKRNARYIPYWAR